MDGAPRGAPTASRLSDGDNSRIGLVRSIDIPSGGFVEAARGRPLARKWRSLAREFSGRDAGLQRSLNRTFEHAPDTLRQRSGIDPALMDYSRRAIATLPAEN